MKARTYLMSFERMVRFLQDDGVVIDGRLMMSDPSVLSDLMCAEHALTQVGDLFEKFLGTWWEIELGCGRQRLARCYYLADSLQDALRLRPDIDTSYWCDCSGSLSQFLSEVTAWQEDECFLD